MRRNRRDAVQRRINVPVLMKLGKTLLVVPHRAALIAFDKHGLGGHPKHPGVGPKVVVPGVVVERGFEELMSAYAISPRQRRESLNGSGHDLPECDIEVEGERACLGRKLLQPTDVTAFAGHESDEPERTDDVLTVVERTPDRERAFLP